jgi:hypothetical protein
VDLQVYLGNYNLPDDQNAAYTKQRDIIEDAIKTYGTDHIEGRLLSLELSVQG